MAELETEHNENRDAASDLEDPFITAEQLAKMRGFSLRHAQQLIKDSGIAETSSTATPGRPKLGFRWSALLDLRDSYREHAELFLNFE